MPMPNKKGVIEMARSKNYWGIRIITAVLFLLMVLVNALANTLPINGVQTGEVSDSFPNLFAPAGITFAIWGLIYLLLAGYSLYQIGLFQKKDSVLNGELVRKIGILFSVSSLANILWIFAWHYYKIPLTMVLMIIILVCLIMINLETRKYNLSLRDKFFVRLPFSIYFGWITVATIANVTTLLVSIGWDGFGISEPVWTVIIIVVGLAIAVLTIIRNKDIAYGLVIIWAYIGILIKHTAETGFAGAYTSCNLHRNWKHCRTASCNRICNTHQQKMSMIS
jgi:hypothetical protein